MSVIQKIKEIEDEVTERTLAACCWVAAGAAAVGVMAINVLLLSADGQDAEEQGHEWTLGHA
jgi:hypothetical protein